MLRFVATAAILGLLTITAQARSVTTKPDLANEFCGSFYCGHHAYVPIYKPQKEPAEAHCTHHGCREARGSKKTIHNHPTQTGRPSGAPHAWCGYWLMQHLGLNDRHLWVAREWAHRFQRADGPAIGRIVVWAHHVGIITGHSGGEWVVLSGNDGNAVRERPRSIRGAIAFVVPNSRIAGR